MTSKDNLLAEIKLRDKKKYQRKIKATLLYNLNQQETCAEIVHDIANPLMVLEKELQTLAGSTAALEILRDTMAKIKVVPSKDTKSGVIEELVSIQEVVIKALRNLARQLTANKMTLHLKLRHCEIKTNQAALQRVLENIIKNAVDALADLKRTKIIEITCLKRKNHVVLQIKDNGGGIQGDLSQIFNRHYTTKPGSQGLGLHICKTLVEKNLRGKINVKSTLGKTTIFSIILPMEGW